MSWKSRQPKADGNHSPCPECGTLVYWRDGPYCYSCRENKPTRTCGACGRLSTTAGVECHHCGATLSKALVFGLDSVSPDMARCKAWPKDANPFAKRSADRFTRESKKAGAIFLISGMRSCFVCGGQFQLGQGLSYVRHRAVANPKWDGESKYGRYVYDTSQKAHASCPFLEDEHEAMNPTVKMDAA